MLKVKDVTFQYVSNQRGLPLTNLDVPAGSFNLITGPSGSGKSTLCRCLTGIIPQLYQGVFSGEVWLSGYNTASVPLWQLSEKAGMVFQNPAAQVLAPTVEDEITFGLENLGLSRDEIDSRLEKTLERFNLAELRKRSPATLSGGEQQKLVLAAITARHPAILVLDEPLSMLDPTSSSALVSYLEDYSEQGSTVVMFEHRKSYLSEIPGVQTHHLDGGSEKENNASRQLKLRPLHPFHLQIKDLTICLGGRKIFDRLNLELEGGGVVALVGQNGVGKTTLLRAMMGLQKYDGVIQGQGTTGGFKPELGMVFQNPDLQLFNPTVREEILYRVANPELEYYQDLIDVLGLRVYENSAPLLLSEGEKKRLALALVLIHRPRHGILLDEPSLGQDDQHKDILMGILRSIVRAGQMVLMTTHDLALASQADRVILLSREGVVADGIPDQVFKDPAALVKAGISLPPWFVKQHL